MTEFWQGFVVGMLSVYIGSIIGMLFFVWQSQRREWVWLKDQDCRSGADPGEYSAYLHCLPDASAAGGGNAALIQCRRDAYQRRYAGCL